MKMGGKCVVAGFARVRPVPQHKGAARASAKVLDFMILCLVIFASVVNLLDVG